MSQKITKIRRPSSRFLWKNRDLLFLTRRGRKLNWAMRRHDNGAVPPRGGV